MSNRVHSARYDPDMPAAQNSLLDLVTRLSDAATWSEVHEVALKYACPSVGATAMTIALTNRTGAHLDLSTTDAATSPPPMIDLYAESALTRSIRDGEAIVLGTSDLDAGNLESLSLPPATTAVAAVPVVGGDSVSGGIAFGYTDRSEVAEVDADRARMVGKWIGRAFEHARYRERGQTLVDALRTEFAHQGAAPRGLSLHGKHRPAWAGEPLGGDWYDAFTATGGAGVVIVGDVAGHGVAAAPTMIAMRSYLRAIAFQDPTPQRVLNAADQILTEFDRGTTLVTLVVGIFDPAERTITIANAGMPAPILRSSDGRIEILQKGRSRILGSGLEPMHEGPVTVSLQNGDTVLFHTDGVLIPLPTGGVEIDDIIGVLRDRGGAPLEELVTSVLDPPHRGGVRMDDATVLAVRVTEEV